MICYEPPSSDTMKEAFSKDNFKNFATKTRSHKDLILSFSFLRALVTSWQSYSFETASFPKSYYPVKF